MHWQDCLSIGSAVTGVVSLIYSVLSFNRTGKIQEALKAQSDNLYKKRKEQSAAPKLERLIDEIQKDNLNTDQVASKIKENQMWLYELGFSSDTLHPIIDKIMDKVNANNQIDYQSSIESGSGKIYQNDYMALLAELKYLLEREVE
jgi:glutamate/tyrosine decarboxylase-like PLP-dependent enzyme